ncbi:MAG: serine/threonine-protein phosphatase, partial [Blastocatellia bacterium]|nr:serine/threonine-protein phosphatase [Blastocatellia bacterium]
MENNFNITSAAVSDRGLSEKRPENEDSFLILEERGVYAVADGVGGAQAGDVASQMAMEILGEAFINLTADLDAEDVMRAAIDRANGSIHQMAADLPQLSSMATTIVALHVYGNIATIGHVGDSRAYRLDHASVLRRETDDHSVVEEEVRAGRMTPEQAVNHPSKNVISRALGAEGDVEIELKTIMVEPGTTFLLCSDGVTRHISDGEISEILEDGSDPAALCARIKEICYERGAEDNLTAVIVRVSA